jgi:hypothetical protein
LPKVWTKLRRLILEGKKRGALEDDNEKISNSLTSFHGLLP